MKNVKSFIILIKRKEGNFIIWKYIHNHLEKECDTSILTATHRINDEIRKSSIPLGKKNLNVYLMKFHKKKKKLDLYVLNIM